MPRFTIKMLVLSTTLIAAAIWLATRDSDRLHSLLNPGPAPYMRLVLAGAMFGAGILAPFAGLARGAMMGGVTTVAYFYFY